MKVIGLTGGIGSGKSTAALAFRSLGIPVVDADAESRKLTAAGSPVLDELRQLFGSDIFTAGDELNRAALRDRVFSDPQELAKLEALLHPAVRQTLLDQIDHHRQTGAPYCIVEVPLLFEKGFDQLTDRNLVIDLPESLQIERVKMRSGLSEAEVRAIIAKQIPRAERLSLADIVISNTDTSEALNLAILALHEKWLKPQ